MGQKGKDKRAEEKDTGESETKQLALRLPKDLHLKLKLKCVQEDRPMADVLVELIEQYLKSK
jgi:predicted DNA-binding protein